ncbi:MAG: prolyl oligopeptidase family serine peptidase [Alphaproteobacteria bacterium]|nr:prolyl oligopeptidase family serine peptidase [Alphaproteobacteria bacterium]
MPVSFFWGDFWEDYKAWLDNSPIMHVEKVTTPTLIQHGDNDTIVTIDQSYEFYQALRVRKIPTQFIVYKNQGHGINEDAAESASKDIFNWLQKYVEPSLKNSEWGILDNIITRYLGYPLLCNLSFSFN